MGRKRALSLKGTQFLHSFFAASGVKGDINLLFYKEEVIKYNGRTTKIVDFKFLPPPASPSTLCFMFLNLGK